MITPQHPEWAANAKELAQWAWDHLVNRTDAWGGYNRIQDRDKTIARPDGTSGPLGPTTTKPAKSNRGQIVLTPLVLEAHFRTTIPELVVGLHTTSPDNTSKWGAVEVDHHGESSTAPAINLSAALAWYLRLCTLGFRPLLTDSNGKGGYHLRVIFDIAVSTPMVFAFLRWLTRDHATHGLIVQPETFPKQPSIPPGGYGNWLRLPGRHHTHEHWTRVWDGTRWLEGADAVDFILKLHGDPSALIPINAVKPSVDQRPRASCSRLRLPPFSHLATRIRAYMAKLPSGLGEGQHRDDYAYQFAAFLIRDLALAETDALSWLEDWDSRQAVAKGRERLKAILRNALKYGHRPFGCGHCGRAVRGKHPHVILTSRVEAQ